MWNITPSKQGDCLVAQICPSLDKVSHISWHLDVLLVCLNINEMWNSVYIYNERKRMSAIPCNDIIACYFSDVNIRRVTLQITLTDSSVTRNNRNETQPSKRNEKLKFYSKESFSCLRCCCRADTCCESLSRCRYRGRPCCRCRCHRSPCN